MKKLLIISLVIFIIGLIVCTVLYMSKYKEAYDKAVGEAKEEFVFDYDEDIIEITAEQIGKSFIITIYGEKTLATYIYHNGEIWNYENQSN